MRAVHIPCRQTVPSGGTLGTKGVPGWGWRWLGRGRAAGRFVGEEGSGRQFPDGF